MTTPDQIREAYKNTLQCSNGLKIEDCFEEGAKLGTICCIFTYLRLEKSPFGAHIINLSAGKEFFYATYKMGEFEIVFQAFDCNNDIQVHTVESFAKWLNDCERKILEAAKNLIKGEE